MGVSVGLGGKRAVAVLGVAAILLVGGGGPAFADGEDDARAVYCLTVKSERNLRAAGTAIGVDVPQDVTAWRKDKPSEFERVCSALHGAEKTPSPGWFTEALPFLTGLFGALLAFAAAAWRDRITRSRKQGEDLRAALTEFETASRAFLGGYVGDRSDTAVVVAARAKLVSHLAVIRSEHRGWSRVESLLVDLRTGSLGPALTGPGAGQGDEASARAARLDQLRDEVLLVATAVTTPLRPHSAMSPRTR